MLPPSMQGEQAGAFHCLVVVSVLVILNVTVKAIVLGQVHCKLLSVILIRLTNFHLDILIDVRGSHE